MNWHFGETKYPGALRFHRGTITHRLDGRKLVREHFFEHPIRWWCGVSFARLFIGIIRTAPTREETGPSKAA